MSTTTSKEGGRWLVKSALGYAIGIALLALWVDGLGARPELAIGVNHVLIGVWNYALTDRWVFRARESPRGLVGHVRRFVGFQGVMLVSNGTKYVLFLVLLWADVWYIGAWTVAALVLLVVSFSGNRWLWAVESPEQTG